MSEKILASKITPLLSMLYVLVVDLTKNGEARSDKETLAETQEVAAEILPTWESAIPIKPCLDSCRTGKNKLANLQTLGVAIKALTVHAEKDQEIPQDDIDIFKACGAYFRTQSDAALSKLKRAASASKNPWVVQQLAPSAQSQGPVKQQLQQLIKSLVGRDDTTLTTDEILQIKETHPEEYKQYQELRKAFNQSWKDTLVSYIRKSGKDKVSYEDALEFLRLNGVGHSMPEGFTGYIDDRSRLYTEDGEMIDGVPNATNFPIIKMNPNRGVEDGGDWVFQAIRPNGEAGPYFYTSDFKKHQSLHKFSKVAHLLQTLPSIRKKWLTKVRRFNMADPQCVISVVLETLFLFAARVGTTGNSTYGVSTLLVKHAKVDENHNITLSYLGKDSVKTTHKLLISNPEHKPVIAALLELLEGKAPTDRIFTYGTVEKHRPITPASVNAYFKALGAGDCTVHKIRTYNGTLLFKQLLDQQLAKEPPKTRAAALDIFKKMAETVGKKLNHVKNGPKGVSITGVTALNAYVDPALQCLYFQSIGQRLPAFLEKYAANSAEE